MKQVGTLKSAAGLVVKTTRAYKSTSMPDGLTQTAVEEATGVQQPYISKFENGDEILKDPDLGKVLDECGVDRSKPGGAAFFDLLKYIRDHEAALAKLEGELPD